MDFAKMQGAGNDFILIETGGRESDWAHLAQVMCDRHFGIGSDGLLLLSLSSVADYAMRMFNPDGTEAEACGNGLRCCARYIRERGLKVADGQRLTIETAAGIREVNFSPDDVGELEIRVAMGVPQFNPDDIPVALEAGSDYPAGGPVLDYPVNVGGEVFLMSFVSMGNPHAVYFSPKPLVSLGLSSLGPKVENHPMFPHRTNFHVARVIGRGRVEALIWERGAGETLASGSGASAVAVISRAHGFTDDIVDIILPGGVLKVGWDGVGEVYLSGPAEIVFAGQWPEADSDSGERNC